MKKYKLLKIHWFKVLAMLFFVLLFGVYSNVFAAPTPGEIIDSNCSKGDVICVLKTSTINTTISIGNFLQSTSTSLASGWSAFTYGLLNNITDSVNGTKEFAVSVGDGAKLIGNGIAEGWTSTENFVASLFDKKTNSLAIVPIIKTPTPITVIPPPVVTTPTPPIPTSIEIIPVPQQIIQSGLTGQMGPRGLTGLQGPRGEAGRDGNIVDTSSFVSRTFLDKQVNGIFDSIDNSTQGLSSSLSEEVITKLLTVSGDATIGGNITITGNITGHVAGTINPSFTLGSIPFQGATGLAEDNANLFWDKANSRLGIGTMSPSQTFQVGNSLFVNASGNWMGFGALNPSWWQSSGNIWFEGGTYFNGGAVLGSDSGLTWGDGDQGVNGVDSTGLMFSTGGSERMRIANSGNVGIGTATPRDTLEVVGNLRLSNGTDSGSQYLYNSASGSNQIILNSSGSYGTIQNDAANVWSLGWRGNVSADLGTPVLSWNSSGNVGIGTATPTGILDVNGGTAAAGINGNGIFLSGQNGGTGNTNGGTIFLTPGTKSGTNTTAGTVSIGYTKAEIDAMTWLSPNSLRGKGYAFMNGGYIAGEGSGIVIGDSTAGVIGWSNGTSGWLNFYTNNIDNFKVNGLGQVGMGGSMNMFDNTLTGAAMAILANGNVGIGTTSPVTKLHVVGDILMDSGTNSSANLKYWVPGYGGTPATRARTLFTGDATGTHFYSLDTDPGDGIYFHSQDGTSRMFINDSSGNVGIGTTTPTSLLQVGGNGGADGSFDVQANLGDSWFSVAGGSIKFNEEGGITTAGNADLGARFNISPVNDSKPALSIRGVTAGVSDLVRVSSPTVTTGDYFTIKSDGKVGIGTPTPAYKLDVNGAINATSVLINGVAVGAGGTQWASGSGGVISYTGGNVGIGTATPAYGLDVETGSIKVNNNITGVGQSGTLYLGDASFTKSWGGSWTFDGGVLNNNGSLSTNYSNANTALSVTQSGSGPSAIFMGGNIGIGTTTPGSLLDITKNALGTTVADTSGLSVNNTTLAAAGVQQISPSIRWAGQGWATTTPASQSTEFISYLLPVQGTTNPSANLIFASSMNGIAYAPKLTLTSGGALTMTGALSGVTTGAFSSTVSMTGLTATTGAFSGAITNTLATTGLTYVGGLILNGPAATLAIPVQNSPVVRFSSQAWNTTVTAVTKINAMDIVVVPTSGTTTSSRMVFKNTTVNGVANANELMTLLSTGNVGIGTATPAQKLDVVGSISLPTTIDSTSGVIYKGTSPFIHNFNLAGTNGYNTFVGINAGNFTMTGSTGSQGSYNTGIGQNALVSNTTGNHNSAMGMNALYLNTEGYNNLAIGQAALYSNTTGSSNTANGMNTLHQNTTGNNNTANGMNTLAFNTIGYANSANGAQALYSNTTGYYNSAEGVNALYSNNIGFSNTALGYQSGYSNTTGSNNIVIGNNTDLPTVDSSNMLSIGNLIYATGLSNFADHSSTISTGNVGIGTTTPNYKLSIGSADGTKQIGIAHNNTDAYFTTDAGDFVFKTTVVNGQTGFNVYGNGTASGVIRVGSDTGTVEAFRSDGYSVRMMENSSVDLNIWQYGGTTSAHSALNIYGWNAAQTGKDYGKIYMGNGTQDNLFIDAFDSDNSTRHNIVLAPNGGNVGIGTTSPGTMLTVGTASTNPGDITVYGTSGSTCTIGNGTSGTSCSSDLRLKDNITTLGDELSNIMALRPVSFNWKDPSRNKILNTGLIAQEVQTIYPNMVHVVYDDYLGIDYAALVVPAIKAIQEMNLKVNDLSSLDTTSATSLGSLIKNFLADVGNGIGKIFVKEVNTDTLCVSDVTGAKTCINKAQLDDLLAGAGSASGIISSGGSGGSGDETLTCTDTQTLVDNVCVENEVVPTCSGTQTLVENVCVDNEVEVPTCTEIQTLVDGVCTDPTL